jgi:hypothetical protein
MGNWNQVYFIPANGDGAVELTPEYYKGRLIFRLPGSSKRISYKAIKVQLKVKQTIVLKRYLLFFSTRQFIF